MLPGPSGLDFDTCYASGGSMGQTDAALVPAMSGIRIH